MASNTKGNASPDGGNITAVETAANKLQAGVDELVQARKISRYVRYGGMLLFLLVVIGWGWKIYASVNDLTTEATQEEYKTELTEALMESVESFQKAITADDGRTKSQIDEITNSLFQVIENVKPVFAEAFSKELEKAGKVLGHQIEQQAQNLERNVMKRLDESLSRKMNQVEEAAKRELKKHAPDLEKMAKGVELAAAGFREGAKIWLAQELETTLRGHMKALDDIRMTLQKFLPDEAEGDAKVDTEQLLGLWIEVVYEQLGGDELLTGASEETGDEKKTPKKKGGK